jgi:hypothetical protein
MLFLADFVFSGSLSLPEILRKQGDASDDKPHTRAGWVIHAVLVAGTNSCAISEDVSPGPFE